MPITQIKPNINENGITYYKLVSNYVGDVTKNCGLSAAELDANFYFLRGRDIADGEWNASTNELILRREDNTSITIDGFDNSASLEGTYYDNGKGILHLKVNGIEYPIDGFYVGQCCENLSENVEILNDRIDCLEDFVSGTTEGIYNEITTINGDIERIDNDLVRLDNLIIASKIDIRVNGQSIVGENNIVNLDPYIKGKVEDVKVGGTSVVSNNVAEIIFPSYDNEFNAINNELLELSSRITHINEEITSFDGGVINVDV